MIVPPITSTMVEPAPPGAGPASMIRSGSLSGGESGPNEARTAAAVLTPGEPEALALVEMSGQGKPAARPAATGWGETRTAIFPAGATPRGRATLVGRIRVSGPGPMLFGQFPGPAGQHGDLVNLGRGRPRSGAMVWSRPGP